MSLCTIGITNLHSAGSLFLGIFEGSVENEDLLSGVLLTFAGSTEAKLESRTWHQSGAATRDVALMHDGDATFVSLYSRTPFCSNRMQKITNPRKNCPKRI